MYKKLVFVFVLVALVAITNAKPQGEEVTFDNGQHDINIVDQDQQINVVDGAELQDTTSYIRGGGSSK